jgi:hypothetical protein
MNKMDEQKQRPNKWIKWVKKMDEQMMGERIKNESMNGLTK